jgi:mannose-6-phosphate isomerase
VVSALSEISTYLSHVLEFAALIPPIILSSFQSICTASASEREALRNVFAAVMTTPFDIAKSQLRLLIGRYKLGKHTSEEEAVRELIIELDRQFLDGIGVFCVYLLNVVNLEPGEAIFLGAGEPHAYVAGGKAYGDCLVNTCTDSRFRHCGNDGYF